MGKKFVAGENFLSGFGCSGKCTILKCRIPTAVNKGERISRITSKNVRKYFRKFWELYRKISKIISNNFGGFREIRLTFSRGYFSEFWELILKIIAENFEKYFGKIQ